MFSSKSTILKSFDFKTGKGTGNMTNWYLCNGRYGTPNLNNNTNNQLIQYIIQMPVNGKYILKNILEF